MKASRILLLLATLTVAGLFTACDDYGPRRVVVSRGHSHGYYGHSRYHRDYDRGYDRRDYGDRRYYGRRSTVVTSRPVGYSRTRYVAPAPVTTRRVIVY